MKMIGTAFVGVIHLTYALFRHGPTWLQMNLKGYRALRADRKIRIKFREDSGAERLDRIRNPDKYRGK